MTEERIFGRDSTGMALPAPGLPRSIATALTPAPHHPPLAVAVGTGMGQCSPWCETPSWFSAV